MLLPLLPILLALSAAVAKTNKMKYGRLRQPSVLPPSLHKAPVGDQQLDLGVQLNSDTRGFRAPTENIWRSLSNDEATSVIAYLHKQTELNLTSVADAGSWDNTILVVDLLPPNKSDALAYLNDGGRKPERWAVASLSFAATAEPYLEDWKVGPLPISARTTHVRNDYYTTKGENRIRNYNADYDLVVEFKARIVADVEDIVLDLLNATYTGDEENDEVDIWGHDPLWHDDGRVISWEQFWRNPTDGFDSTYLLPQGLYMKLDITGRDPSEWRFGGWFYSNVFYSTSAAFRSAWEQPDFVKLQTTFSGDSQWAGTDRQGEPYPLDYLPPPVQVNPERKHRFQIDKKRGFVSWMGHSFFLAFTRDTGVRLWNLRFGNDSIAHEWGLMEAIAQYAGSDPVQANTGYLDTFYGFGPFSFNLVPNFDCPVDAVFLPATFHANEVFTTHPSGICVFEQDLGYPLQRHSTGDYVSITKNIILTPSFYSTFDYNFFLDGSLENTVRASGYIQSAHYSGNDDYGYNIREGLSGSMHDHAINFKLDLDVAGVLNSVANHSIVALETTYPWSNHTRSTMHLVKDTISTETAISWGPNSQSMIIVDNRDELNPYGVPRGYRIAPSKGSPVHLTIQNSTNLLNSQSFATRSLYALQRKDSEARSAHSFNTFDPANPIIDFACYLNNESLEQTDVVLFYNLGMHHVPHTGDLPNTVTSHAVAGMMISPHNFFLRDPSRRTKQMLRIDYSGEGVSNVSRFGSRPASGTYSFEQHAFDYNTYESDSNVRKFPYDPLNPYNNTEGTL